MFNSKISKYVYDYINKKETTSSEAKLLYHKFEKIITNNENVKKIIEKSEKIHREYTIEQDGILNIIKSIEMKNSEYSRVKFEYCEIKSRIEKYLTDLNKISIDEEKNKELLANEDKEYNEILSQFQVQEKVYIEKVNLKKNEEKVIDIELEKKEKLNKELNILKLSILSLESCCYVKNKQVIQLEDNLKSVEDNTRCMLGMISLENTGVLTLKAEYAGMNNYKQNLLDEYEHNSDKINKDIKENKQKLDNLIKKIAINRKAILQIREKKNELNENIKSMNQVLKQMKSKLTLNELNIKDINNTLSAIKRQIEKQQEKNKLIFYLFKTNREFDLSNIFNDESIISEAKAYYVNSDTNQNIDINNENIILEISNLVQELDSMKKKLLEKDENISEIRKIQEEICEKIINAKKLNSELLEKQRELSNREESLYEKKNKLNNILLFKTTNNSKSDVNRQVLINKLIDFTEKLGKKLIQANPNTNILSLENSKKQ
ncbi:restin [Cryptosporidium xiaoi]|uniref:Restin n=1 Tax=Cryptosporidium xiaoi TaxID=659607 RepID=A0AAV9XU44_9CRYT